MTGQRLFSHSERSLYERQKSKPPLWPGGVQDRAPHTISPSQRNALWSMRSHIPFCNSHRNYCNRLSQLMSPEPRQCHLGAIMVLSFDFIMTPNDLALGFGCCRFLLFSICSQPISTGLHPNKCLRVNLSFINHKSIITVNAGLINNPPYL